MKLVMCEQCKKIAAIVQDSACPTKCCGEPMVELVPNTTDGAHEKHVPAVEIDGNKVTVTVGEVEHPMMDAHYIQWIILETNMGRARRELKPGAKPQAVFMLAEGEEPVAANDYCDLHGFCDQEV